MPAQPPAAAIRTIELSKSYGRKPALSNVSLEVQRGERFCLLGANGCGKTTLLEILMGIKRPTAGTVEVLGLPPNHPALKSQRALLMERAFFPYYAKVKEVLWMYAGFYERRFDHVALLEEFELDADQFIRHLSKGQRQRLGILLTAMAEPTLILLDEPTSGLDPQSRLRLWQIVQRLLAGEGARTLLFCTHNLEEAQRWADRIAVLQEGSVIAVGSPEELCRRTVGTSRKLTLMQPEGSPAPATEHWSGWGVAHTTQMGSELALYTDHPEELVGRLTAELERPELRIENVTLRDAYFKLTGEVPDGHRSLGL
jgi:ABC-2 type transport system ATP-binding protein